MPKGPAQPLINKQFKKKPAKKQAAEEPAPPVVEPPQVETKALSLTSDVKQAALTGPLTPESLEQYQQEVLVRSARTLIPGLMRSLREGLRKNDKSARDLVAAMYSFTARGSGVSVVNNIQNNYSPTGSSKRKEDEAEMVYFESIVRGLDAEAEKKKDDANIIDVEAEEVK